MDRRVIWASDFNNMYKAKFCIRDHYHSSRVYRAIALLFSSLLASQDFSPREEIDHKVSHQNWPSLIHPQLLNEK